MSVEQEAGALGWVPLDHFKGAEEKWVDAETYLARGKEILPILKKTNEGLRNDLTALQLEVQSTKQLLQSAQGALTEFQKYHEEDSKRQYERAMEKLKGDKKEALRDNDVDAIVEIDDAIRTLEEQERKAVVPPAPNPVTNQPVPPGQDPVFTQWAKEQDSWFGRDEKKTAYAVSIGSYIKQAENLVGRELLDRVAEEVEAKFGEAEDSRPNSRVEGGSGSASTSSRRGSAGKSYADLPKDCKQACDRFGEKLVGPGKMYATQDAWRKQYVKDYFGGVRKWLLSLVVIRARHWRAILQ